MGSRGAKAEKHTGEKPAASTGAFQRDAGKPTQPPRPAARCRATGVTGLRPGDRDPYWQSRRETVGGWEGRRVRVWGWE